jgi:hypothetical protein
MRTLSIILGSIVGTDTHGRKKFTWPKQWESLFVSGRQSTGHYRPKNLLLLKVRKEICER